MKKLFLGFALVISTLNFSQTITINVFEAEYLGSVGKHEYVDVINNPDVVMNDRGGIDASYIFNLKTNKLTYTTNNETSTVDIITTTIGKYKKLIKFNDIASDGTNRIVPVNIELDLSPDSKNMIMSWYNVDKNRTMVQMNKVATYSIK